DELLAKVADMRYRAAEGSEPETQEGQEDGPRVAVVAKGFGHGCRSRRGIIGKDYRPLPVTHDRAPWRQSPHRHTHGGASAGVLRTSPTGLRTPQCSPLIP